MKKLVLAMACVLSLGLLASCKQGVQDVNLQNQDKTEAGEFYGKLEGTFKLQTTTGAGTTLAYTDATTTSSLKGSENWGFSKISWSETADATDSNYKTYTLKLQFAYNSGNTNEEDTSKTKTFTVYKIGSKYYMDDYKAGAQTSQTKKAEVEFTEGDFEASSFTIKSLGYFSFKDESAVYSSSAIKFTRAE